MTTVTAGDSAPGLLAWLTDPARSAVDFTALAWSSPLFAALPRGDGHPVLVLPGLATGDLTTTTLRTVLKRLGYRTYGWRLGRNLGPTARVVRGMQSRLDYLTGRYEQPVTVIGWSLGGIYARRLARENPDSVRQVITLGSPFKLARTDQSRAHRVYAYYAHRHIEQLDLPVEGGLGPLPVPATSIYSRLDGIVAWRACLDDAGPRAENIEVYASHLGFGHHPAVIWAVADRLARPAGQWAPFRPPSLLSAAFPGASRRGR